MKNLNIIDITTIIHHLIIIIPSLFAGGGIVYAFLKKNIDQEIEKQIKINRLEPLHIESNSYEFRNLKSSSEDTTVTINYNGIHYQDNPHVFIALSRLDLEHGGIGINSINTRLKTEVVSISRDHFVLKVWTWDNSYIYEARINWIAFGYKK